MILQAAPISSLDFRLATLDCVACNGPLWRDVREVSSVRAAAGGGPQLGRAVDEGRLSRLPASFLPLSGPALARAACLPLGALL